MIKYFLTREKNNKIVVLWSKDYGLIAFLLAKSFIKTLRTLPKLRRRVRRVFRYRSYFKKVTATVLEK